MLETFVAQVARCATVNQMQRLIISLEMILAPAEVARLAASYAAGNKSALAGDDKWSDVDSNPNVPGNFGIRSIPALLVFKGGQLVDQTIGVQSKDALKRLLERHM